MSRLSKTSGHNDPVSALATTLQARIAARGTEFKNPLYTEQVISTESLDAAKLADAKANFEEVLGDIKNIAAEIGIEDITDTAVEAATITAMGVGDGRVYHEAATRPSYSSEGTRMISLPEAGQAGLIDASYEFGIEAFDNTTIDKYSHYSIAFNMLASQQDSFAQAWYPTIVLSPDQGGLDVTVEQSFVYKEIRRALDGSVTDWNKKRIIDAMVDPTILENEATKIYPIVLDDDSNAGYFVDAALIAPMSMVVDTGTVRTAPIKLGATLDLLAISQGAGNLNGQQLDYTDSIDPRVNVDVIYFKVSDGTNDSVVSFKVLKLPTSGFYKSPEGKARETVLQFKSQSLTLTEETVDITGSKATALGGLSGHTVRLGVSLSGELDLEIGTLNIYGNAPSISALNNPDGERIAWDSGIGQTLVQDLTFELLGYDLEAFRSNKNLRQRGLLIDVDSITERYAVHFGSPISAVAPIDEAGKREATDLKSLIRTTRTRTSNDAVTSLINYAEALKAYVSEDRTGGMVPDIEGSGRHLVYPYFVEVELDLMKEINSARSHEKAADVADVLVNVIRSIIYPMAKDSNYQAALEQMTNGQQVKPQLLIGTDSVIQQHLMVSGDERTASIGFDHKVVISPDERIHDYIYLTFVRPNKGEPDPLSFGVHAFMPELVSSAQVSRGGSTTQVTTVQSRSRHCNLLPILARIHVTNLKEVLQEKTD